MICIITTQIPRLIHNLNSNYTKFLAIYKICHAYSELMTLQMSLLVLVRYKSGILPFFPLFQYSANLLCICLVLDTKNTDNRHICYFKKHRDKWTDNRVCIRSEVGRIMLPLTHTHTKMSKMFPYMDFVDMVKWSILGWDNDPKLSRWVQRNHMGP